MKFFRHCLLFVLLIGWLIQPVNAAKAPEPVTFAPPTNFSLDDNEIAENSEIGDPVGTFSATDPEGGTTFTYALTTTEGANDNASFQLQGNELQANAAFDFEVKNTYQIEVTVTDAQSETTVSTFTINITDANEAPTDIELNGTTVAEDAAIGTTVGTLSTVDPDVADTEFTYLLVDGTADNADFTIDGNELQTAVAFDIEADETRQVLVRTSDAGGETFEETLTITVTNVDAPNQPPTDITLTNATIDENQEAGTLIGSLDAVDAEDGPDTTFAFELVDGAADNNQFSIVGNELRSAAVFDFETKASYEVRIRTADSEGEAFEKTLAITVTNVNEPPTDIALIGNAVSENAPVGTTVGLLSTVDPDASDVFTYALVDGAGGTNNDQFTIEGNELRTAVAFAVEADETREVRIRTTDAAGESFENAFTIDITNADVPNQPPTDIALSNASIAENQPELTFIGRLSTTDADDTEGFVYEKTGGDGSANNASFRIKGDSLLSEEVFDFETKPSYQVRVQTTDPQGASFARSFTIDITNVDEDTNQPPTDITLDSESIAENQPSGSLVGNLSTIDLDSDDSFTYTLTDGEGDADNASFRIQDDRLLTETAFDFETKQQYQVRITTTDADGASFTKPFTIQVTDIVEDTNQPPTDITLNNAAIAEEQPRSTLIGRLATVDVDNPENYTYQKVGGEGSANNSSFRIQGDSLLSDEEFDFETKKSYQVRIQATDTTSTSNTFSKSFTIDIVDISEDTNQPPTDITLDSESIAENQPSGSLVGNLSTIDLDSDDSFTYTLTDGEGDADNASFRIQDDRLLTETAFDFETKQQYQVRITTTDADGASFTKAFTIQVTDINEDTNQAPTDLILSSNTIAENEPFNSEVGRFTVEDPDASDSHTVTLVEGEGDDDNGRFQIRNNILYSLVSFDFEERSTYSIRVQGKDPQQATVVEIFTISVTDVTDNDNQAPTDIILSNTQVSEGQIVNLVVGTLSAEDADLSDTHTFTLVPGEGDDDNDIFSIADKQLQTAQVFNFNTQARYRIRVRADDGRGGTVEKSLTITVTEGENNAPIVANPIPDLSTAVGQTFSYVLPDNTFTDADAADVLSYAVALSGATPLPEWLTFDNNTLILSGVPPEDSPDSLVLSVTATDSRGASVSDEFTLAITRVTAVDDEVSATWTVYPVPTDQRLVTVEAPLEHGLAIQFRLLDTSGRLVKRYPVGTKPSVRYVLPLPEALSTGAYFLEIRTSDHTIRKRIMLR